MKVKDKVWDLNTMGCRGIDDLPLHAINQRLMALLPANNISTMQTSMALWTPLAPLFF